jgi:hypothetical protein
MNPLRLLLSTLFAGLLVIVSGSVVSAGDAASPPPAPSGEVKVKVELLFVQSAVSGAYDGKTMRLNSVGPTIWFSDRPLRVAGHVLTSDFVRRWNAGEGDFIKNPPNATLSLFGKTQVESAVVEISNPVGTADTLSYDVKVLQGQLPASFGECSLFIDLFGRWAMFAAGSMLGAAAHPYYAPYVTAPFAAAPVVTTPVYTEPVVQQAPPQPAPINVTVNAPASPPAAGSGTNDAVARLKELKSLFNQGLISQAQYQEETQKVLNQLTQ